MKSFHYPVNLIGFSSVSVKQTGVGLSLLAVPVMVLSCFYFIDGFSVFLWCLYPCFLVSFILHLCSPPLSAFPQHLHCITLVKPSPVPSVLPILSAPPLLPLLLNSFPSPVFLHLFPPPPNPLIGLVCI